MKENSLARAIETLRDLEAREPGNDQKLYQSNTNPKGRGW